MTAFGVKRLHLAPATIDDHELLAAQAGGSGKIRVVGGIIAATGGANTLTFKSADGGNTIAGPYDFADNQIVVLPIIDNWELAYFVTDLAEGLFVALSAATAVTFDLVAMVTT